MENIAKIHEEKETIKAIVEAQLNLTFESVGTEFFLLDGDITLEQTLELEKITLSLTNLLFEWMKDNININKQIKVMEKGTMWKMLDQVEEGTHYEVYRDIQGNIFNYEDGELKFTEIYNEEKSYD